MIAGSWSHIINDDLSPDEMPTTIASTMSAAAPLSTSTRTTLSVMENPNECLANSLSSPENTAAVPLHELNVAVLGQDRTFAQPLIDMLLQRPPSTVEATDETTLNDTELRRLKDASQRFLLPLNVALSPCWIGTVDGQAKEQTWASLQALERLLTARWNHVHGVFLVLHRLDPALFAMLASLLSPSFVQVLYVVIPSWRRGSVPSMAERQTMFGKYFDKFGGLSEGLMSRMLFFDLRDTRDTVNPSSFNGISAGDDHGDVNGEALGFTAATAAGLPSQWPSYRRQTLALLLPTAESPGAVLLPCECVFASSYPQQWWIIHHDALTSYGRFPWRFIVFVLLLASLGIQQGRLQELRIQLHAKDLAIAEKSDALSQVSSQIQQHCVHPSATSSAFWHALSTSFSHMPAAMPAKTATKPKSVEGVKKHQSPLIEAKIDTPSPLKEAEQTPASTADTTSADHAALPETPEASTEANTSNQTPPPETDEAVTPPNSKPVDLQPAQNEELPPPEQPQ